MTLKEKVAELLSAQPYLRDNDKALVTEIWGEELKQEGYPLFAKVDVGDILWLMVNVGLSNYDSITRARRELQEFRPALRGENWYKNHQS